MGFVAASESTCLDLSAENTKARKAVGLRARLEAAVLLRLCRTGCQARSDLGQGLIEIGDQIIQVFGADGEAQQIALDPKTDYAPMPRPAIHSNPPPHTFWN